MINTIQRSLIYFVFLLPILAVSCDSSLPSPSLTPTGDHSEIVINEPMLIPNQDNVLLWLDAASGVETDEGGKVIIWRDRLQEIEYTIDGAVIEDELNGLPVIRMEGGQGVTFEPELSNGPATTFVVFKRDEEQGIGPIWQRVLSVWDGQDSGDLVLPSYAYFLDQGDEIIEPSIMQKSQLDGGRARFTIGMDAIGNKQNFFGDIAEVIIFDGPMTSVQQIEEVYQYLSEKWGISHDFDLVEEVTRGTQLTEQVERTNHNHPLSDQDNREGWIPYEPWTDEFDDGILDVEKWLPHNHVWYGRAPCRFLPENVVEGDGIVSLAMKKDSTLPIEDFYNNGDEYQDYSCATLSSLEAKRYGYIEARARAGVGSSAFWLYAETYKDDKHNSLEIDVYELGGVQDGYETMYNMNTWVHALEGDQRRFDIGERWDSGIRFADDFHVFGLKWTEDTIEYYLDGILVRRMPNLHWHSPLLLLFDTETMPEWFLVPDDGDLPGYHEIDYVRAWTNAETTNNWQGEYELKNNPKTNNPTAAYLRQFSGHVDKGTSGPLYDRVWCKRLPAAIPVQDRLTVDIDYIAENDDKNIVVELWRKDNLLGQGQGTVSAGTGTTQITIDLTSTLSEGSDYQFRASIIDQGDYADFCMKDFIVGDDFELSAVSD